VNVTLWIFRDRIESFLADRLVELRSLAEALEHVYELHLLSIIANARRAVGIGQRLGDSYVAIEPRDGIDRIPVALERLQNSRLTIQEAGGTTVELTFTNSQNAALAAVAVWSLIPREASTSEVLDLRFERTSPRPEAIKQVLFDQQWTRIQEGPDPPH
jgi:hypothetical protein